MAADSILGGQKLVAFAPTIDPERARAFYEGVLGLRLVADEKPFALVFDANGTMLRVTTVPELKPDSFTVLGWDVDDIEGTVDRLVSAGVVFNRYKGVNDGDPRGIWNSPSGARVAWFKDPDGNVLSVTEFRSA
ncbi:MAG TPA: VOC family protein [Terracidiphilus sp.]|jgi:catechol 2,3-dioxygenase-like lactoylglutathione lyase family enzyme|nr:VOC family protein [Terracidiphilus sp.]